MRQGFETPCEKNKDKSTDIPWSVDLLMGSFGQWAGTFVMFLRVITTDH